jgi:hypothetical protein
MKLALVYNFRFTKVCINLKKYVVTWDLFQICLLEFIWLEVWGSVKFFKNFKGGISYKSLRTSGTEINKIITKTINMLQN